MKSIERQIQQCEADILVGRTREVTKRLHQVNPSRVPREWRLPLANICRRVGQYTLGMTLLSRLVNTPRREKATPQESAEYAVLLLRSGAVNEALERFRHIDAREAPAALLYRAYAHFSRWEFALAIPLLESYLHTNLAPYARMVGQTNLGYARVYRGEPLQGNAEAILRSTIQETHQAGAKQLESSCRAILAQHYLQNGEFKMARAEIEAGRQLIVLDRTNDHFLVRKWELVLDGLEYRDLRKFDQLKTEATHLKDWEALREADFYRLKIDHKVENLLHLYVGTPYQGFRERFELGPMAARDTYVLGKKTAPRFDLRTGEIDGRVVLSPGKKCHQLLCVLLNDFYQPARIAGLFSELFPGEHFNITSSPDRVHQVLRRTRRLLEEARIPMHVAEIGGFYKLDIASDFSLRVPVNRERMDSQHATLNRFRAIGKTAHFTAQDIQRALDLTRATTYRLIERALEEGKIEPADAQGRTRVFQFATPLKRAA